MRPIEDLNLLLEVNMRLQSFNKSGYIILVSKNKENYFKYQMTVSENDTIL